MKRLKQKKEKDGEDSSCGCNGPQEGACGEEVAAEELAMMKLFQEKEKVRAK